jgi:hypothetical protein
MAAKDWARGRRGNQTPGSRLRDWQGLRCVALGCLSGVPVPQVTLLPRKTPSSLALLVALIVAIAPRRADEDVAVSQLPRPVLKAAEAVTLPGTF